MKTILIDGCSYGLIFSHHLIKPYFNDKFGIGTEKFHFKVNGEAWIANQEIKAGELYKVSSTILWKATTPLMFEIEEFGWSNQSELTRFIQGVRWTVK